MTTQAGHQPPRRSSACPQPDCGHVAFRVTITPITPPTRPCTEIHGDYVDRVRGRRASGSCRARACARRRLRPPRRPHVITPTTTDGHRHASHEGHRGDHRPARPLPANQPGLSADRHGHRQGLSPRPKPAIGKSRAVGVDNLTSRTAPRGWPIAYRPRRPHGPRQVRPCPPTARHTRGLRREHAEMADMSATGDTCA